MDELRIPFLVTPGGKSDKIIKQLMRDRVLAQQKRVAYLKSKGKTVVDLWGSDRGICALLVNPGKIPKGWRQSFELTRKHGTPNGNILVVPDGRQRETFKALKQELRDIPALPDCWALTSRLGSDMQLVGMRALLITFEKVGKQTVLAVPIQAKPQMGRPSKQFVPPDCKRLKLSQYYALKEKNAKKN